MTLDLKRIARWFLLLVGVMVCEEAFLWSRTTGDTAIVLSWPAALWIVGWTIVSSAANWRPQPNGRYRFSIGRAP